MWMTSLLVVKPWELLLTPFSPTEWRRVCGLYAEACRLIHASAHLFCHQVPYAYHYAIAWHSPPQLIVYAIRICNNIGHRTLNSLHITINPMPHPPDYTPLCTFMSTSCWVWACAQWCPNQCLWHLCSSGTLWNALTKITQMLQFVFDQYGLRLVHVYSTTGGRKRTDNTQWTSSRAVIVRFTMVCHFRDLHVRLRHRGLCWVSSTAIGTF